MLCTAELLVFVASKGGLKRSFQILSHFNGNWHSKYARLWGQDLRWHGLPTLPPAVPWRCIADLVLVPLKQHIPERSEHFSLVLDQ